LIWLLAGLVIWIDGLIGGQAEAVVGVSFFGVLLGIEKLITIHHAKRYVSEYIPKENVARIQPAVAGQKT
jgi:hypothetical protein